MNAGLWSYCLHLAGRKGCQRWSLSFCWRSLNQARIWGTVYLHIHAQSAHCETRRHWEDLAGDRWGPLMPNSPGSLLWKPPVLAGCHTCLDPVLRWTGHLAHRNHRQHRADGVQYSTEGSIMDKPLHYTESSYSRAVVQRGFIAFLELEWKFNARNVWKKMFDFIRQHC